MGAPVPVNGESAVRRVAVVGAGLMGHGIALELALAGLDVRLHSRSADSVARGLATARRTLERLSALGVIDAGRIAPAMARIGGTDDLTEAAGEAELVIETVYEDVAVKRATFEALDRAAPPGAILASNTSTLPLAAFSAGVRPDRVMAAHYGNPPYLVPVVELVRGAGTSDATVGRVRAFFRAMGKTPVVIARELPGFIVNRLQAALVREAMWLVQDGYVTPSDVDAIVRGNLGRRWAAAGPFEVMDLAGVDLYRTGCRALFPLLSGAGAPPPMVEALVAAGATGVRAGRGFHAWTPAAAEALWRRLTKTLALLAGTGPGDDDPQAGGDGC
ncbi:MAG TPA: 3-hydroxyacyl-CoA dehydrogenase family protein [Gemmatimonadaceae bacterium]|nr:3-hydroxyacyl-CoA dehydrogenase family protein [Gemmatimonadaceae bacterium]